MPLPYRLSKHATLTLSALHPTRLSAPPRFQQELLRGRNGEIYAVRPLCQWTTYPDSLGFTQAHGTQRACCWKSVSLGHEALPGITWYLLQCRVRPGNPGLLAPAQSPLSQRKRLGQKAVEIGRVKYCCRGNVAGHTSRFFAPGCPVSPITYLLPDCNLSPSGTFAPGAPDSLPCSAAESSGSGTPGTAETRPSLLPSSQNYCRLIPSAPFPHTLLLFPCKADLRCLSVLPFCRAAVGHPKTLLQGA